MFWVAFTHFFVNSTSVLFWYILHSSQVMLWGRNRAERLPCLSGGKCIVWRRKISEISQQKNHNQVVDWLYKCEKTLDFFFTNQPEHITEEEVAKAEHEEVMILFMRMISPHVHSLKRKTFSFSDCILTFQPCNYTM